MSRLIECVPNFSEGNDLSVIRQITDAAGSVEGVSLLDVDPGKATNRTVVTFVGSPEDVIEAAVRAVRTAARLIDMAKHRGEHPRMGATDVCPLIPVAGVTMEECVGHARELARRLGEDEGITVFCYENAATSEQRRNLAVVRDGEYEGLREKLSRPEWQPDFGPAEFNPRSGATVVGARDFLVAYNVNLNTTSTRRANAIAFDVREKGRVQRKGDPLTGEIVKDDNGDPVFTPGSLKCVKGIGWFIEEYGVAQISMNLTNIAVTPVHVAFDEVCERARARGVRVTGSELVGLIPKQAMLDAGRHYLRQQQRSVGVPDAELIRIAILSMGLSELTEFRPEEKIIEYAMEKSRGGRLVDLSLTGFVAETASEKPAPGGGSVAAALGALGAALATMVANLSAHKRGWDDRWEEFSDHAEQGKKVQDRLLALVDEDTAAFDAIMSAFSLAKKTPTEQEERRRAIQAATTRAIETPLEVMETALASMEVIAAMADTGLASSVSDAGVGALCARAAVRGAVLNVRINCGQLEDQVAVERFLARAAEIDRGAAQREKQILDRVEARMSE